MFPFLSPLVWAVCQGVTFSCLLTQHYSTIQINIFDDAVGFLHGKNWRREWLGNFCCTNVTLKTSYDAVATESKKIKDGFEDVYPARARPYFFLFWHRANTVSFYWGLWVPYNWNIIRQCHFSYLKLSEKNAEWQLKVCFSTISDTSNTQWSELSFS